MYESKSIIQSKYSFEVQQLTYNALQRLDQSRRPYLHAAMQRCNYHLSESIVNYKDSYSGVFWFWGKGEQNAHWAQKICLLKLWLDQVGLPDWEINILGSGFSYDFDGPKLIGLYPPQR